MPMSDDEVQAELVADAQGRAHDLHMLATEVHPDDHSEAERALLAAAQRTV